MKNFSFRKILLASFIVLAAGAAGYYWSAPQTAEGAVLPIAGQTYTLAGSGVSSSASSITLASLTVTQTGQKIQDSDMSTTFFLTLEPGNRLKQELVSCTTVVQNANNTATLSGCLRGLAPITPYTASSTMRFVHSGGTEVIFSDPPQFFNQYLALANSNLMSGGLTASSTNPIQYDNAFNVASSSLIVPPMQWIYNNFVNNSETQTVNGAKTFTATTTLTQGALVSTAYRCTTNSDTNQLCEKAYIDGVAIAGASNANTVTKGIVEEATQAEVNAGTTSGGTGAELFVNPATLIAYTASSTYFATTSTANLATTSIRSFELPTQRNLRIKIYAPNFVGNSSSTDAILMAFNYAQDSAGGAYSGGFENMTTNTSVGNANTIVGKQNQMTLLAAVGSGGTYDYKQKTLTIDMTNATGTIKQGSWSGMTFGTSTNPYYSAVNNPTVGTFIDGTTTKITSIDFWFSTPNVFFGTSTSIQIQGY